jgi:TolB-like protein/Flp pilus assembly protein TadD
VSFWSELKRRRVIRVALTYIPVGVAVVGGGDLLFDIIPAPDWTTQVLAILVALGFPLAVALSWAYDVTPAGVVRTTGVALDDESEPQASTDDDGGERFPRTSIVILPFTNLSEDPENGYFTDGVMEDILSNISRLADLHVISRTSAMAYRDTSKPARQIAGELRVGSILEGSVRRAGDRVRVVAQLIDATSDRHLWAETYDRDVEDIFRVQSDVAENIARSLQAKLEPEQVARIRRRPTEDLRAYELCVRGRQLVWRLTAAEHRQGLALLERAIELDPEYALAHAYLSYAWAISPYYCGTPATVAFPAARAAAERALELDDGLAGAWAARGIVRYHFDWDWNGALDDFDRAARLDPNDPDVHYWRGYALSLMLRWDEAVESHRKSTALDPRASLRLQHLGLSLFFGDRPEEGLRVLREAIERDPSFFELHFSLGVCLLHAGRLEEGVLALRKAAERSGHPWPTLFHALSLRLAGRDDEAHEVIRRIGQSSAPEGHPDHIGPSALAIAALAEGDLESAVAHMEEAAERRAPSVLYLRTIVTYPGLREHAGFQALNRRIWAEG